MNEMSACTKCGNRYLTCDVQSIIFDSSLVVDATSKIIYVEITNELSRYRRT